MRPAIILSSHTMGLGVIRALGMMDVPLYCFYYEKKDMGYVSKYITRSIFCPHPEKEEEDFIRLLLGHGNKTLRGGLLVPVDDATISAVSKHKEVLARYYSVACPDEEIARKYVNKKYTYELAEQCGVPCPKTVTPKSLNELQEYARQIAYPCIVKPCESHKYFDLFRKKMTIVNNSNEMVESWMEAHEAGTEVMIQEYIPGEDSLGVNYNSYFIDGEPVVEFTAEKVRYSPPGIGVPRVVVSKIVPEVVESGRKILKALNFNGYSCTEFKRDPRDGVFKLMEINGRHNRSTMLAVRCGINFPWVEYAHHTNREIRVSKEYEEGVYWIDELRDILHSIRYFKEERYTWKQYARPYLCPKVCAIFDINDMRPFVKRVSDIMKMAGRKCIPQTSRQRRTCEQ